MVRKADKHWAWWAGISGEDRRTVFLQNGDHLIPSPRSPCLRGVESSKTTHPVDGKDPGAFSREPVPVQWVCLREAPSDPQRLSVTGIHFVLHPLWQERGLNWLVVAQGWGLKCVASTLQSAVLLNSHPVVFQATGTITVINSSVIQILPGKSLWSCPQNHRTRSWHYFNWVHPKATLYTRQRRHPLVYILSQIRLSPVI